MVDSPLLLTRYDEYLDRLMVAEHRRVLRRVAKRLPTEALHCLLLLASWVLDDHDTAADGAQRESRRCYIQDLLAHLLSGNPLPQRFIMGQQETAQELQVLCRTWRLRKLYHVARSIPGRDMRYFSCLALWLLVGSSEVEALIREWVEMTLQPHPVRIRIVQHLATTDTRSRRMPRGSRSRSRVRF